MTETKEKNFEILDAETVQTMDFILRGLELGKFDDTAKKVEFLGKLSGDETPKYIATLLSRIDELEIVASNSANTEADHLNRIVQLESQNMNLTTDLQAIASGLRQLFEPSPLKNNWDFQDIQNFCNKHGA